MAHLPRTLRRHGLAGAALCALAATAAAQQPTETVTITGRTLRLPGIAGFGDAPLDGAPLQARSYDPQLLQAAGVQSLAGLAQLDAGVSDAYNSEGYWSLLSLRGFVIDPRSNYRRDGLPINGETAIGLANKSRIDVLKGTSGIQAGVSAPGGLVDLVIKRPDGRVRDARFEWRERGTLAAAVDLGDRFGDRQQLGLRLNAAFAELRPQTRHTDGRSHLLALAGDLRIGADTLLEAEVETSRQRQPSVPGFSLLGDRLPAAGAIDPRLNLNNQPWSLPVVLDGTTASLRWQQRLAGGWRFTAHGAVQRLTSDDRVAFPFGCYDAAADVYYADRYCPDGRFDLYDYRSEGERRRVGALDLRFDGRASTAGVGHDLSAGVLIARARDRFNQQAYNFVGQGLIDGSVVTEAAPGLNEHNTNRDERSTEWYLRDRLALGADWSLWAGVRHTRLERESVRTDPDEPRAIVYTQSFTTPWLALSRRLGEATSAYLSWGRGIESDVAPNRARYVNRGEPLPALESRQVEAGVRHAGARLQASVAVFRIVRPLAADIGACDEEASCIRRIDGDARHQGVEATLGWSAGAWRLDGSALWLDAERRGATDPAADGLRPTNVPERTLKLRASHDLAAWPGLRLQAALVHEGPRMVLPDNSIEAPGWTRVDLGATLRSTIAGRDVLWQLALDNVTDRRAWRETPYQFGHVYLFPLAPRQWRVAVQTAF